MALICIVLFLHGFSIAFAQADTLSIQSVLQQVQNNFPQLEVYRQQAASAQQSIALAKNSLTPDLNAGYQLNMATFNNITGMSYPGFLLPISGPPSVNNTMNFVPGSALGALAKWNPFTFGQRNAAIEKATARFNQANAAYSEQLFRYQYSAINIYLEIVYCRQVLKSLQANIDRSKVSLDQALVLAKTGLRQGIDTTQFQSLIAQAEIDYLQMESACLQKTVELTRLTGNRSPGHKVFLTDTTFNKPALVLTDTSSAFSQHPYYKTLEAAQNITSATLNEIKKSLVPQLDIWGNVYARGSGIDAGGNIMKSDGLALSRTNAGIGVQLVFPILKYSKVNLEKKQYRSLLAADNARLSQAELDLSKQLETAILQFEKDVKIANLSPVLLKAADDIYKGLQLGYETGLIDFTRLSVAQYELQKAEVNNASAVLQVWRSLLAIAVAKGDLALFTDQLK